MDAPVYVSTDTVPGRLPAAGWFVLALAFAAYGVLLAWRMGACAGASDSSGYLNTARLLQEGNLRVPQRAIDGLPPETLPPYAYVPLGFIPSGARDMVPTYPIGLSLLIGVFAPLSGWEAAPGITMWLHGMAGVLLMFALARAAGLSRPPALFGATLLAFSPVYLFTSVELMSDTPALVWCTAAVLCAWRSRQDARWALAAGAAVAIAVLVRPADLLILAPVSLCLGLAWRRWLWLAVGGAPGAALQLGMNLVLYGRTLASGYGAVGQIFAWQYGLPSLANYAGWLPVALTPAVLAIPVLLFLRPRGAWLYFAVPVAWILAFTGFYAFYLHTHEKWWYLRFIIPAFPALILLTLFAGRALFARCPSRHIRTIGVMAAAALLTWDGVWTLKLHALDSGRGEEIYPEAARWLHRNIPANAVVASMQTSGSLLYYTGFTLLRWDRLDAGAVTRAEQACAATARPLYAALFPFEIEEQHCFEHLPGRWTRVGAAGHVTFWRYDGPSTSSALPP